MYVSTCKTSVNYERQLFASCPGRYLFFVCLGGRGSMNKELSCLNLQNQSHWLVNILFFQSILKTPTFSGRRPETDSSSDGDVEEKEELSKISAAIFYSITSTQKGKMAECPHFLLFIFYILKKLSGLRKKIILEWIFFSIRHSLTGRK